MDFFLKVGLDQLYLDNTSEERIEFIHNTINFFTREFLHNFFCNILLKVFPCNKFRFILRQISNINTLLLDNISKLLQRLFRPPFSSPQEFSFVFFLEHSDRFIKFYLSCSQRVDLHELLEVEEGLGNGKLV